MLAWEHLWLCSLSSLGALWEQTCFLEKHKSGERLLTKPRQLLGAITRTRTSKNAVTPGVQKPPAFISNLASRLLTVD